MLAAGTPGPSIAALVSRVISHSWRDVMPFLAAMWIGEILWLAMAMAGLTALAQTFQLGFHVLKWLGIAYLCWLAFKMWHQPVDAKPDALPQRASALSMFGTDMALTLGNPKIMVFCVALLPSLIDVARAGLQEWAILACVTIGVLATIDLTWAFVASKARLLLRTPRAMRIANRSGAAALVGAAAAIALRD